MTMPQPGTEYVKPDGTVITVSEEVTYTSAGGCSKRPAVLYKCPEWGYLKNKQEVDKYARDNGWVLRP
jgi:hypothetical protein